MMVQISSPTVAFALIVVIQSVSSQLERTIDEPQVSIPGVGVQSPNPIITTPDTTAMNPTTTTTEPITTTTTEPITTTTTEPTTTTTINPTTTTTIKPTTTTTTKPINTTTMKPTTTTTMKPETIAGPITTNRNPVTELNVTIDNKPTTRVDQIDGRTIGLAVGIGGGGLILLIVLIVVLIVVINRRQRRSNGGSDSRTAVESSDGDSDKTQNDVYAAVVPGKNQANNTESSNETIYTTPVFTKDPNSTPPNSDYEEANRVKETYIVSPLRGQARSIYPQEFSDLYANSKEVRKPAD